MITVVIISALCGFIISRAFVDHAVSKPLRQRIMRWHHASRWPWCSGIVAKMTQCGHCFGFWVTWPIAWVASANLLDQSPLEHLLTIGAAVGLHDLLEYAVGPLSVRKAGDE